MIEKVLCVDDDPNVLMSYQRMLRRQFTVETAEGGETGLKALAEQGPFAVVLSDLAMPGMNGIEFLTAAKEWAPETVRIILTGNAELEMAIESINSGHVFRFLRKPCSAEQISASLEAGIHQYRLVTAERELLKNTLTGSVQVLTEVLSMVNPAAFSQAVRIRRYVKDIAAAMKLPDLWQFEVAAMLSQIGCITLPPALIKKLGTQHPLTEEEQKLFTRHPTVAAKLLSKIPRLEAITLMIERQLQPFHLFQDMAKSPYHETIALGAQILRATIDFDRLLSRGLAYTDALSALRSRPADYNPQIVAALERMLSSEVKDRDAGTVQMVVKDVQIGMVAAENIIAKDGFLLVPEGHEITHPVLLLLRNVSRGIGVSEPFRVIAGSKRREKPKAEPSGEPAPVTAE